MLLTRFLFSRVQDNSTLGNLTKFLDFVTKYSGNLKTETWRQNVNILNETLFTLTNLFDFTYYSVWWWEGAISAVPYAVLPTSMD